MKEAEHNPSITKDIELLKSDAMKELWDLKELLPSTLTNRAFSWKLLGRSLRWLYLPYSRLIRYLKERDLHAIRVLEPHVVIAPRSDDRRVDQSCSMRQQPFHCGFQVGHL